ncbi:MAG: DUF89 family protein [Ignavibacteriales bacterium]|nr:MAG: DUF89 family protein [Ignavibacteriales bacterium]
MNIKPKCIACTVKQAYNAASLATYDEEIQRNIINEFCNYLPSVDPKSSPPEVSKVIQSITVKHTGIQDPYKEVKDQNFSKILKFKRYLETYVDASKNPFEEAIRIAIAGNTIDLGANPDYDIEGEINKLSSNNIVMDDFSSFKEDVLNAKSILYIADNFEEAIFDKFLIEQLLPRRIYYAVRSKPILNDISLQDVNKTGIDDLCVVIESGSDLPGTVLDNCTDEFKRLYDEVDLVISKGQGNFETLENCKREIYFLFKVKCDVIEKYCGQPIGKSILIKRGSKINNNSAGN